MKTQNNDALKELLSTLSVTLSDEDLLLSGLQANIAATISSERIRKGMSQKDLADSLRVSQGLVSRWESGECNFTLQTLVKIAQELSIKVRSPFVSKNTPHYHWVKDNITHFPGQWSSAAYTPNGEYTEHDDAEEM